MIGSHVAPGGLKIPCIAEDDLELLDPLVSTSQVLEDQTKGCGNASQASTLPTKHNPNSGFVF